MSEIEYKEFEFKVDRDTDEEGVFRGVGSGFGDIDQVDDIVMPDAFNDSLLSRPANAVKCLWQHNQTEPLGYYRSLLPKGVDLIVEGKIFPTTLGKDALILMKGDDQGKGVDGLSIGFRVTDFEFKTIEGRRIRIIKKAELIEISVVTFPAHLRCRIQGVKMTVEQIEEVKSLADAETMLKEFGMSNEACKKFIGRIAELKKLSGESESHEDGLTDDEREAQAKEEKKQKELEAHKAESEKADIKALGDFVNSINVTKE